MKCPFCGFDDSKVVDSRHKDNKVRRRRECIKCSARFTTFETVEKPLLMVEKKGGTYEPFNRNKLIQGIFSGQCFETSIPSASAQPRTHQIYDLQGRQIQQPTRGIYIRGGRKVVVK